MAGWQRTSAGEYSYVDDSGRTLQSVRSATMPTTPPAGVTSGIGGGNVTTAPVAPVDPALNYDNGEHIASAAQMDAPTIAPVERVTAPDIGAVNLATAATMPSTSLLARTSENPYISSRAALLTALQGQANGTAPSLAELQLRSAGDRLLAQQRAQVAATRGVSPALAMRASLNQGGDLAQQLAAQIAAARLQERNDAQTQLASVQTQGQTLEQQAELADQAATNRTGEVQSGLTQQTNLANAAAGNQRQTDQAELTTRDAQANQLAANTASTNQAQLQATAASANQAAANARAIQQAQINAGVKNQQTATAGQVESAGIGAAGTVKAAGESAAGTVAAAGIGANAGIQENAATNAANVEQNAASNATTLTVNQGNAGITSNNNANSNNASVAGSLINGAGAVGAAAAGGGGGGGGGGTGTTIGQGLQISSDRRVKKNVIPADDKIEEWLASMKAKNFEYKNQKASEGKTTGVMAQDMEKSDVGKEMVNDSPNGKVIDIKKGLSALFAAQANLNKRMAEMESKKKAA